MILWGKSIWLLALLVPVVLFIVELMLRRRDRSLVGQFASRDLWPRLAPGSRKGLVRLRRILFLLALALLALAIANPRIGTRYEDVVREGIDIVLAVDVSRSMDSQDIRPSRIGKARYELARFIEGMKGDRVGIVPFAGSAYPLLPLTLDYAAARLYVDLLATDLIPNAGTALGEAVETALKVFPEEEAAERARVIVLVSDGEDHGDDAMKFAREAADRGVTIYTIGMAREKGDPIPVFNDQGERSGWLTDDDGQIVTSRLNEDILREIALTSGGEYRRADQGGSAFRDLYRELFQLEKGEFEARRITGHEDRFQPILLAALVLLLIQFFLPTGRRVKRSAPQAVSSTESDTKATASMKNPVTTSVLILTLLTLGAAPTLAQTPHELVKEGNKEVLERNLDKALEDYLKAQAKLDTLRPELLYNLGGVYARKGETGRADTLFRSLKPYGADDQLLARGAYNRGTALAEAEQYEQAVPALIEALKRNPDDQDAKVNLELALRKQQQQQQQQNQDQDQNDQNQQDKQDQQKNGQQKQDEQQQDQQNQQNEQDEPDQQQKPEDQQQDQPPQDQQEQQQPQPQELNKEMAERLLDQMQQDEKEQLKNVIRQQVPVRQKGSKKPW